MKIKNKFIEKSNVKIQTSFIFYYDFPSKSWEVYNKWHLTSRK